MANMVELGWIERIEALIARLQARIASVTEGDTVLQNILQNRVQQVAAEGVVVAAGGPITLDASITTVGPNGKVRVSAHFSGQVPATTTCRALIQMAIAAGAFGTQVAFAQFTAVAGAPGEVADGMVFEIDTGVPAGTVLHFHWQTSLGDGALTLAGGGVGAPIAACLLVEELP